MVFYLIILYNKFIISARRVRGKLKKINNSGFVLAETLVVTVFLMVILCLIYTNFYPLIGEYEKRETYDDVDSTYAIYWIKKLIEDSSYSLSESAGDSRAEEKKAKVQNFTKYHYVRFECSDVSESDEKRSTCINLVNELEVANCDKNGDGCDIFITEYQIGNDSGIDFKNTVNNNLKRSDEDCTTTDCKTSFINKCKATSTNDDPDAYCTNLAKKKVFKSSFQDYVVSLPDYTTASLNHASYRVIVAFQHTKDNNNYYSYATTEVSK
jgi:hypothetical protein